MTLALADTAPEGNVDEQQMLDYAAGDTMAFEYLYRKHSGALYRYFVRQIGDRQLAEDLFQETWRRVIKAASSYEASARFTTWLYRIAHNLLVDHVRAVKPVVRFSDIQLTESAAEFEDLTADPGLSLEERQKSRMLLECVALLPQVQKEVFLLNCETGLPARVVADIVGISHEAGKSRIRYAYQSLKECVAAKWEADSGRT